MPKIDYLCFTPNGEPTLDRNISKEISLLREFGYKIAVITNGSLLWNDNVKENLLFSDYVSVKLDTVDVSLWEKLNHPHPRLKFETILRGISDFAKSYKGILTTETMLVNEVNDNIDQMDQIGKFLNKIDKDKSYFTIPTRPPSKKYAIAPNAAALDNISAFVKKEIPQSEMLCCPEIVDFKANGDFEEEFLSIISIHPMIENSVREYIKQYNKGWDIILKLIINKKINEIKYLDQKFYARRFIN